MTTASVPVELQERLSLTDKFRLAAEVIAAYAKVRWLLLRRIGLPVALAALRGTNEGNVAAPSETSIRIGLRLGGIVRRTLGRLPADSRCLVRSLVLTALLAHRGIDSRLVIGVQVQPSFAAHAWVEAGDTPLLPTGRGEYERLLEL
jgi:Transglutaminase-like superfamily